MVLLFNYLLATRKLKMKTVSICKLVIIPAVNKMYLMPHEMEFDTAINWTAGLKVFVEHQLWNNIRQFQYSPQTLFCFDKELFLACNGFSKKINAHTVCLLNNETAFSRKTNKYIYKLLLKNFNITASQLHRMLRSFIQVLASNKFHI